MKNPAEFIAGYLTERMKRKGRIPLPLTLKHRHLYIFPVGHGLIFFAILLAILSGAVNHNNNLAFILAFLLAGMSFISLFHTFRNLRCLKLVSVRAAPVFAGQPASFELCLESPGSARWSLSFTFDNAAWTSVDLAAGEKQSITLSHATTERGVFRPELLSISTTYPLGLFRCWSHLYLDARCLVYPRPLLGPTITAQGQLEKDSVGKSGGPGVEDFAGLKSYQPGDPMQHLSWKSFSRGQGLQKKLFEGQLGTTLYFDLDALPGHDLEWKLSRICHMILQAEALRTPYGLRLGNRIVEPALGGAHKRTCLRLLALYRSRGKS